MPESLTPPQGLIAVTERKTIYGFPMGIGSGGAGTKVTVTPPPAYGQGSGLRVFIVSGDYVPAVLPPTADNPAYDEINGGGVIASVITPTPARGCGAGTVAAVITPTPTQNGSGCTITSVEVVSI